MLAVTLMALAPQPRTRTLFQRQRVCITARLSFANLGKMQFTAPSPYFTPLDRRPQLVSGSFPGLRLRFGPSTLTHNFTQ